MLRAALPRVEHVEQSAWSSDEARAFLDATADDPDHALFVVALTTGARRIRLHDARHAAASLMLQAGVPLNVVSRRLGHGSAMVTLNIYSHVLPGQGRDAADRLGTVLGTGAESSAEPG